MHVEQAYAKINLYLDVESRRANGYHNIVSIMQTVSLQDTIRVEFTPTASTEIILTAPGNHAMPLDQRNLAWRAADRFLRHTNQTGRVEISIEKQIPMAAGLAGGSADAAAVFRALNSLCTSRLSTEELCALGSGLGADIPFCIVGGSALVTGIGEVMEPAPALPPCYLVVACMGEGVSTVWAYGELDERYQNFTATSGNDPRPQRILEHFRGQRIAEACPLFYNIFEDVVCEVNPYVEKEKSLMEQAGAIAAMMSGSGPSVFGIFEKETEAEQACAALKDMGARAFVCQPTKKYSL
ncbi:MAG: 4-(cytidine 5'-diphospho)-2-C-methyl-D-erythritol kinase [Clostridia bacterium]|nr:4-(cytidine 5'-diphospho)-2-C-methyl-D-erythritol kinase [Clostridia bacterium]